MSQVDFTDALEKVELGSERKLSLTAIDRERIAYHESGHALLGLLQPGADPVRRVSIIPRGQSLGATVQSPVDDRFSYGEDYLRGRITGALGGRAAEQLVYGIITTGAEADLRQVTGIARQMVVRWGMSPKVGVLSLSDDGAGAGQALALVTTVQRGDRSSRRRGGAAHLRGVSPPGRVAAHQQPRQARRTGPRTARARHPRRSRRSSRSPGSRRRLQHPWR